MSTVAPTQVLAAESENVGPDAVTERRYDLIITPIALALLVCMAGAVWVFSTMDETTQKILEPHKLWVQLQDHVYITAVSTVLVVLIAIPLGVLLTRPAFRKLSGPVLAVANSGQAIPAYGLLVLFYGWIGRGSNTVVIGLIVFGILPVLRNTMVGLDQVDRSLIEAGRGMGYSRFQALTRIELPLAVPIILAGVRTALVINVGTAALAVYIGGGGLGETIVSALKLQRNTALFIGASLVAMLALLVDWLAAVAQYKLRPKGL